MAGTIVWQKRAKSLARSGCGPLLETSEEIAARPRPDVQD
jgi:hypothetical protein